MSKAIRIGGASGFWGESMVATPQLLQAEAGGLDYLVYDYLAEITMSILARARSRDPEAGYANDFVTGAMRPNLQRIAESGVKVLSNAGGVNPQACARAVRGLIAEAGLDLRVAVVTGDDLLERAGELAASGATEMFSQEAFPAAESLASINAYLGAFPIAKALEAGADIVITGRSVDSAVTLAACIHAFGWQPDDWDRLAAGSLAGHILECGPQATGGNFTDWHLAAKDLHNIGYPIAEVSDDGTFVCTKPAGTGGLVSPGTLGEQMLYEIGDPQNYLLPDVACDFSEVAFEVLGADCVQVSGARGRPAPDTYKVCATWTDGFRGGHTFTFYGLDAAAKARTYADAVLERARTLLRRANLGDFREVSIEVIGAGEQFGRFDPTATEVVLKLAVKHDDERGIGALLKEMTGLALATPPGLSGFAGARPRPSPVVRLFSFTLPKDEVRIQVDLEGEVSDFTESAPPPATDPQRPTAPEAPEPGPGWVEVPLVDLAWGRSGDKGDSANIGIMARDPAWLPYLWSHLDEARIAEVMGHFVEGEVQRFLLPGAPAINFLLTRALGGGGVMSLRNDPQGKGYAQILLSTSVPVPAEVAERINKGRSQ